MAPKPSSFNLSAKDRELLKPFYDQKLDYQKLFDQNPSRKPQPELHHQVDELSLSDEDRKKQELKNWEEAFFAPISPHDFYRPPKRQPNFNMPVHPAEETASGSITDQVAKDSKDSTASTHPLHDVDTGVTSGGSISAQQAHQANPGPVIAENIGKPASKEELKKRSEELNK